MDIWDWYWCDPNRDRRNVLVLEHIDIVHAALRRYENDNREMMFGYGVEGLIQAIERYRPARGGFRNYAYARVRGAIRDGWREIDYLPRKARDYIGAYLRAKDELIQQRRQDAGDTSVVRVLDLTDNSKYSTAAAIEFAYGRYDIDAELSDNIQDRDPFINPHISIIHSTVKDWLGDMVSQLSEREKIVVTLYYYENMSLRAIGEVLGVSESRTCQIHKQALNELRRKATDISMLYAIAA